MIHPAVTPKTKACHPKNSEAGRSEASLVGPALRLTLGLTLCLFFLATVCGLALAMVG